MFLESTLTLSISNIPLWFGLLSSLAWMSEAALEPILLTLVLYAKEFSTPLQRVLPESRLCHVGASIAQKIHPSSLGG